MTRLSAAALIRHTAEHTARRLVETLADFNSYAEKHGVAQAVIWRSESLLSQEAENRVAQWAVTALDFALGDQPIDATTDGICAVVTSDLEGRLRGAITEVCSNGTNPARTMADQAWLKAVSDFHRGSYGLSLRDLLEAIREERAARYES